MEKVSGEKMVEALKKSIEHWENIRDGKEKYDDCYAEACPLCTLFYAESCWYCPVRKVSKRLMCAETPFISYDAYLRIEIIKEYLKMRYIIIIIIFLCGCNGGAPWWTYHPTGIHKENYKEMAEGNKNDKLE